jgi:tetratricopeptide (TPR) repeat protein
MITGQRKEAVDIIEQAFEIDPLSVIVNKSLVDVYLNAGRPDDALRQAEYLLDLHPHMLVARELRGWAIGGKGDWKKAAEIFEENHRLLIRHTLKGLFPLGVAYGKSGETEKARECIRKIEQWQKEEPELVLDADLAMIWLSLGDKDKGFHHLFQCVERKMGPVAIIIEFPAFNVPKDDPRYRLLKEMLGLEDYMVRY